MNSKIGTELLSSADPVILRLLEIRKSGTSVEIFYASKGGQVSKRRITPKRIYTTERGAAPYVEAFCHKRQENRTFRADRIRFESTIKNSISKKKIGENVQNMSSTGKRFEKDDTIAHDYVRDTLETLRKKLLDFSARNDLINLRHSERSVKFIRAVDELPDELYERLKNGKMEFKPLPDIEKEPADEQTDDFQIALEEARATDEEYLAEIDSLGNSETDEERLQELDRELKDRVRELLALDPIQRGGSIDVRAHARIHGFDPNYDLPETSGEDKESEHTDKFIQTLILPERLEKRIRTLHDRYQSYIRETGINVLRAAFGFIEWYESSSSDKALHAPILLMPLQMERQKSRQGARFFITSGGDDAEVNATFAERLKAFGVALPEFEEDDTPESYFENITPLFEGQSRWRLRRFVTVGIFPFQKIAMYEDLDTNKWPEEHYLTGHDAIARLLGGKESGGYDAIFDDHDIDQLTANGQAPGLVMDADSSQHSAIVDACNGESLVIQGPPGTGKSQTIANTISAAISDGKSVLFIAEKQAALNVVASRLRSVDLGPLLLELQRTSDKIVTLQSIVERLQCGKPKNIELADQKREELVQQHQKIERHRLLLHKTTPFNEYSAYELIWRYLRLRAELEAEGISQDIVLQKSPPRTLSQLRTDKNSIQDLAELEENEEVRGLGDRLKGLSIDPNTISINSLKRTAREAESEISNCLEGLQNLCEIVSARIDTELEPAQLSIRAAKSVVESVRALGDIDESITSIINREFLRHSALVQLSEFIDQLGGIYALENDLHLAQIDFELALRNYRPSELTESAYEIENATLFSIFSSSVKAAKRLARILRVDLSNKRVAAENLRDLAEYVAACHDIKEVVEPKNLLGPLFKGEKTNLEAVVQVREAIELAQALSRASGSTDASGLLDAGFMEELKSAFFDSNLDTATAPVISGEVFNDFVASCTPDEDFWGSDGLDSKPLGEITALFNLIVEKDEEKLILAAGRNLMLSKIDGTALGEFLQKFESSSCDSSVVEKAYEFSVITSALTSFVQENVLDINELAGVSVQRYQSAFRNIDKQLLQLEARRALSMGLSGKPPEGVGYGPKKGYTEMALIRNELHKQKRHIPTRDLVRRASKALHALKPIWMMSPLAVSQFLPRIREQFDLLVIDEASQMRPEEALAAIVRAKQVVVVGDNMQLPPTDFFRTNIDGDDDQEDEVETESILDLACSRLANSRTLRWHYRSRHPNLIRFSNKRFYGNRLQTFPSPVNDNDKLGVTSIYVGGTYKGGVNVDEAKRIVEEAVGCMAQTPEQSLGIVAMNIKQKELIREEFERLLDTNPIVSEFYQRWSEDDLEPFIIKNLESIQGDERDIIIVSTVYGPDESGGVFQRFGPINTIYGHRRLNVLFSRAKNRLILVTSLNPSDVRLDDNSKEGKRAFRDYLDFAATGRMDAGEETGAEPDSDFEVMVAERLRNAGYDATPQVGVEGFKIDIGVSHSRYRYGYIAGIECDGATYHSSAAARDRDRLRQDILEGLGWRIYRVWSTDWFSNPQVETEKMLAWLNGIRDSLPTADIIPEEYPDVGESEIKFAIIEPKQDILEPSFAEPPTKRLPTGRRRELEHEEHTIVFFEPYPGAYEVWENDELVGEVEREEIVTQKTASMYGAAISGIQKPRYSATLLVPARVDKGFDDIYKALRWIFDEYIKR